jgi:two-component system nitrogen regulation sensor histidine kinase NtrY
LSVAESYLAEHKSNALKDCTAISKTLEYYVDHALGNGETNPEGFSKNISFLLDDMCGLKEVDSAILLDSYLNIIAHSKYSVALHFLNVDHKKIREIKATENNGIILDGTPSDRQDGGIIAISCFRNVDSRMYVVIKKKVDSDVLAQANNARVAYDEYQQLYENRSSLEIAFIFVFLTVGILLLISAIAVAISYSWRIVKPVSNLIDVSEKIIRGNMSARAREEESDEDLKILCQTFNQMIDQVSYQRQDLERINQKLDERMTFTNSVLAGVSSGVIGVDNKAIFIWNTATEKLLEEKISFGEHIGNVFPEVAELLNEIGRLLSMQRDIQFHRKNDVRLFSVRIERLSKESEERFVITFTDLTDMMIVQRKAAWTEVARRVAHEIKNPLTPIQLSAERLRRKYLPQVRENVEVFEELVNVIIRQVGDIKRLIDEFTFFARLPEPNIKKCDLREACRQAVFLMQNADDSVEVIFFSDGKNDYTIRADERLLYQSIVNLIQNAINVLSMDEKTDKKIWVALEQDSLQVRIIVEDNGVGFPKEKMEALATPYFTQMAKGTGLGLAIVKKIVQDHGGKLLFGESIHGGAKVTIEIPVTLEGGK